MSRLFTALLTVLSLGGICLRAQDTQQVRLVYWNIQNGMWDGQGDNYDRFVAWVKAQEPDICVWCEAQSIYVTDSDKPMKASKRFLERGWDSLAVRYGHRYVYVGGHPDDFPQVITSRYPIENRLRIGAPAGDTVVMHGAGWAAIDIAGLHVNVVTLHLAPHQWRPFLHSDAERECSKRRHEGDKWRRCEIQYICEHTILSTKAEGSGDLWMMMGDFNSRSRIDNDIYRHGENSTKFLVHDYVASATPYLDIMNVCHPGEFFPTVQYDCRLDYVYMTPSLAGYVTDASVSRDSYTDPVRDPAGLSNFWRPSDHQPITVDFKF